MKTRHLQLVTHEHSVTVKERLSVYSPYGPVNLASTTLLAQETLRASQEVQLMELLSSLESAVATLVSKSSTVLDTLVIATEGARVALKTTATDEAGTNV